MVRIFTDSTSDMEKEYRDAYGVDYLHMVFTLGGKDYPADLDWKDISPKEFYDSMRNGNRSVTGLIAHDETYDKFKTCLEAGDDIFYVACSSKLSNSVHFAESIAKELLPGYPGRKIVCFDSLRSNYAEGMIAMAAAKLVSEGHTIDEITATMEEEKLKYQDHGTVDTLEYLRRAGRIKAGKAFFGNLFGVKPIILGDAKGNNYAYKKVRGRKASLDDLVDTVVARLENAPEATVFVEHADCIEDGEYVAKQIQAKAAPKKVNLSFIGPIIGSAIGPGAITVNFYGEKVTIFGEE